MSPACPSGPGTVGVHDAFSLSSTATVTFVRLTEGVRQVLGRHAGVRIHIFGVPPTHSLRLGHIRLLPTPLPQRLVGWGLPLNSLTLGRSLLCSIRANSTCPRPRLVPVPLVTMTPTAVC